ncbi:sensor histidine kinase [Catellatospora chokoriensis]|uniref:Anti-sigma regulatory factor n=1 Tax=Catellatospora chokoriensis TaxID=310353 RepID=A0A8J3K4W8_9ACTN|nr:sensor histidine kinase [Catellatospora chokoriensis]GIF92722.1 anti-sigma regulatory factor [Catellatospora chokoriensis]
MSEPAPRAHVGFPYRGVAEYVSGTLAFLHTALDAGNPVLVAVPSAKLEILRDCLGSYAERVRFTDLTVAGRNPGRILPGVLLAFADEFPGRGTAIVVEPLWPGRSPLEYPACVAHEALVNLAFAGRDVSLLCPCDAANLDPHMVSDAHRTHPELLLRGERRPNPAYGDPRQTAASFHPPLPAPPPHAATMRYDAVHDLAGLRSFVTGHAAAAGLKPERCDTLADVVSELAGGTLAHTDGPGAVSVWPERDLVVCQLRDSGQFTDPLAGLVPPTVRRGTGALLDAHLQCDLVRVHARPGATTVRLHMAVPD